MPLFGPPDVAKLAANGDVKGLTKALGYQKDFMVRLTAVASLGKIGAPAIEPLIAAFKDQEVMVRVAAAAWLGQIGAPAVGPLIAALKDQDENVRLAAATALGHIGAPAVEPLITALKDRDRTAREAAADALGRIGDARAVEPLITALMDQDGDVRGAAALSLGNIGDPRAVEPLTVALKDQSGFVRTVAGEALGKIGNPQAEAERPTVVKFESTAPEKTRKAVDLAEHYIGRGHPADAMSSMLGVQPTKPMYKVVQGKVGRESQPQIDMKIVSVASCLPGEDVDASDTTAMARMAFDAIEHYASLPKVQALFLLPYRVRAGTVTEGSAVPPEETCRVYSGVENLLLEVYDELPGGGTITDRVVEQKIDELIKSIQ